MLSSDSDKILNIGKKIGFTQLIKRPKILSDDYIGTDEVIVHAIKILKEGFLYTNIEREKHNVNSNGVLSTKQNTYK